MRQPHTDDVLMSLGHTSTPHGPRVHLYAESADRRLFTVTLNPEEFAHLLAAKVITVRSETPIARPPAAHEPVRWFNVTLHATTNRYLQLPCTGQLQITEAGTDGSVIKAIFRRRGADGVLSAPVEVPKAQWSYGPHPAPAPAAAAVPPPPEVCGARNPANGYLCGMWNHVAHTDHVYTVAPRQVAVIPLSEAETAEEARKLSGVSFPYRGVWRVRSGDVVAEARLLHVFSGEGTAVLHAWGYTPAAGATGALA